MDPLDMKNADLGLEHTYTNNMQYWNPTNHAARAFGSARTADVRDSLSCFPSQGYRFQSSTNLFLRRSAWCMKKTNGNQFMNI